MTTSVLLLLAQANIDTSVTSFIDFMGRIFNIIAIIMVLHAGSLIHDGKTREAWHALSGAFVCTIALPIVKMLMGFGGWHF